MQSTDLMLKRVINISCTTGGDFCPTSWPTERKRYRNRLFLNDLILK